MKFWLTISCLIFIFGLVHSESDPDPDAEAIDGAREPPIPYPGVIDGNLN